MSKLNLIILVICMATAAGVGCDTSATSYLDAGANLNIPDGIDPTNPKIERTTISVDFTDVRIVRVDIPTGRVSISQSLDGSSSLRVTETIIPDGISREAMEKQLSESVVKAQRSFVDNTRLDIKASYSPSLASTDIAFDIRLVLPAGANIEVFAENAPVEIIDLVGNVEIQTANGAVTLDNIVGSLVARTSNRPIQARSISGNVQLTTSEAAVSVRLEPSITGAISVTTTNAPIQMAIGRKTTAALDLTSTGGVISADLTGFLVSDITTGAGFLRGVLNGGGGRIEARTTTAAIEFVGF
ncbi:MAG: hypothetical protein HS101_00750 [Planctomycetia bacterium]|nr:hypothetical protein [Planctomycetia bacterium]MCC7315805.1 hypothetical protein [Planctomycetota bacterium]OQY98529.1 MAG: hypothetical protein B6D36_17430 [Planctomycetes bacterium UTPLA1]